MNAQAMTPEEIKARVAEVRKTTDAAKKLAMDNFEKTWGTRNTKDIVPSLQATIKGSKSPRDWGNKALAHFTKSLAERERK